MALKTIPIQYNLKGTTYVRTLAKPILLTKQDYNCYCTCKIISREHQNLFMSNVHCIDVEPIKLILNHLFNSDDEPSENEPTVKPTENDPTEADILFRIVDEDGNDVTERERGLLLYNGGTVCDDNFNDYAAFAICKEMGYVSAITWESGNYFSFQEDLEIKLDDVRCSEQSWSSCSYTESHNCGHSEDVFLTCLGNFYVFLISNF